MLLIEELLVTILTFVAAPEFPVVVSTHSNPNEGTDTTAARNLRLRLCCNVAGIVESREEDEAEGSVANCVARWNALVDCLHQLCFTQQPLTIRELCIRGRMRFVAHVLPVLEISALGQVLTLLELRWQGAYAHMDVTDILQAREGGPVPLPHLRHLILQRAILASVPDPWDPGFQYDLASLYLNDCKTSRATVLAIVHALAGPSLQRLHLMDLQQPPGTQSWAAIPTVTVREDAARFAARFPGLTLFEMQLSKDDNALATALVITAKLVKTECVLLGQWADGAPPQLTTFYPPPSPVHYRLDRHLTRLEITATQGCVELKQTALDSFLKSSDAQSLQELVVTTVEYDVTPPIVYGHAMAYWTCKNLRLLDMAFTGNDPFYALELCRQMFGFIVTNCPRLRELRIRRRLLVMSGMGGLCLTSRLVHLERLTLCSAAFGYWDKYTPDDRDSHHQHQRTKGAYDDPRWVVGNPTPTDMWRGVSSLEMCRKVAMADSQYWSWMVSGRGKELLWPGKDLSLPLLSTTTTTTTTTDSPPMSKAEETLKTIMKKLKRPPQRIKANKGCCWTEMREIRIEGMSEEPKVTEAFGDRLRCLLPNVRVVLQVRPQDSVGLE
ncbi:hypothetical protein DFQ27_006660 [Actinomortierella ambigua]|uniref:F-box domain-containing protein n=1 Tax=Actinomortierella ambigua TaxID=1343610 RepID=A0A9P6QLM8_9FUNG|nr:hypothetical protein DFQ27_006660 [Actinomortierella ambigua]